MRVAVSTRAITCNAALGAVSVAPDSAGLRLDGNGRVACLGFGVYDLRAVSDDDRGAQLSRVAHAFPDSRVRTWPGSGQSHVAWGAALSCFPALGAMMHGFAAGGW